MGTPRMKQEEEAGTKFIVIVIHSMKYGKKKRGPEGESAKQDLISAMNLAIEFTEGRESPTIE